MQMKNSVFKLTYDNWYPSYKIKGWYNGILEHNLVEIWQVEKGIAAAGADDFLLMKFFETEEESLRMFLEIIALDYVDKKWLTDRGFESV
jgi:hypothetical protein